MTTHNEDRTAGVIATLTDGYVLHERGSRREAMRAVAAECDRRGVQIATLSTPQTIEADLAGTRHMVIETRDHHLRRVYVRFPEQELASLIGRRDLVSDPRSPWAA